MKKRIETSLISLVFIIALNSCCIGALEDYLGNNLYLSEYDNIDRRILYQTESCATSGVEIVPMTVLEIAYNNNWSIAKTGYGSERTNNKFFEYWVIKNDYENLPDPEEVKSNTIVFKSQQEFFRYLVKNKIELNLTKIE